MKFKQIQGQPLEARVVRYDLDDQIVTLTNRDGQEIQIEVAELNPVDKRTVVKAVERQLFQKLKEKANDNRAAGNEAEAEVPKNNNREPVAWNSNLKQATAKAMGTESTEDDRPIVWFRVLGDLRGLM